MKIEEHQGIMVLRDDLLPGGTKSVLMPHIIGNSIDNPNEYVYASPVYGGFQVALSIYLASVGIKATIFCAKRKEMHKNTKACIDNGANVIEVPYGYLSVVEKRAKDYCRQTGAEKLAFGARSELSINLIARRTTELIKTLGREPEEIWCAIGSGTLAEGILKATTTAKIYGVQVGIDYVSKDERLTVFKYPKPFDQASKYPCPFPSMENYDLKAWELCNKFKKSKDVLFWNVY